MTCGSPLNTKLATAARSRDICTTPTRFARPAGSTCPHEAHRRSGEATQHSAPHASPVGSPAPPHNNNSCFRRNRVAWLKMTPKVLCVSSARCAASGVFLLRVHVAARTSTHVAAADLNDAKRRHLHGCDTRHRSE
ncbi:uncharacterized protein Tco025E_07194 [Trypanosoma conorhini]|uniref:Uncharacterized protein n=1 Tax=Trypanosoma conorhini TaxID=83891 RepID=A0A3R7KIL2_9TRYP|nr:uncharacterized protein Tco025E_07194 [Trypanosoma conorhini]RNF08311.1 hypothetical protein Tco025E_07194 [Trypanosoma conorhini]